MNDHGHTYFPSLQLYTFKLSSSPATTQYSPVSLKEMEDSGVSCLGNTLDNEQAVSNSRLNSTLFIDIGG